MNRSQENRPADYTELQRRIIESADEYHFTGEDQWEQVVEMEPETEETLHEFRRKVRAALLFYARAYLVLDMIETDDSQQLEELLEIIEEQEEKFREFFRKNDIYTALDEEGSAEYSRVFSVAETIRALLLNQSNQLASTLHTRFMAG